jgi:hypothetical protein
MSGQLHVTFRPLYLLERIENAMQNGLQSEDGTSDRDHCIDNGVGVRALGVNSGLV